MDIDLILETILKKYNSAISGNDVFSSIGKKIGNGVVTYADAYDGAREASRILTDLFRKYLPQLLVDGKLPKDVAEMIIKPSMLNAGKDVSDLTARIQKRLNENAGIGINPIIPEQNVDQIDGIISGIANNEPYESHEETTMDGVENYYEGQVDDFVHDNADFHYRSGMSPKIERKSSGKCCEWCENLVGTYEYADVMNTGNDVFRRHKNCHCLVLYNPGNGAKRRQNVHSKNWIV